MASPTLKQRMVINSAGNVTINTPDSGTGLTVAGGGATITAGGLTVTAGGLTVNAGGATIVGISGTTVGASSAVLINSSGLLGTVTSSRRYKHNIHPVEDISAPFMQLEPVTFTYKADTGNTLQYGLIAEDVEPLFPDLIVYNKEGAVETVQYHLLHALYIKMLQDHQRMFDAYEATIQDLENRIQILEQK
jgi:hypothetical protein